MSMAPLLRVTARDVAVEVAGRHLTVTVLPFVTAAALLAGLGFGPDPEVLRAVAPGLLWLLVLFAAVPLARGVAAADREDGCWDLLRALVTPTTLLAGKVIALWSWLLAVWVLGGLLFGALFGAGQPVAALVGGPLATFGVAIVTTLYGALLGARPDGGDGLLPVLVLPAAVPLLLAGTQLGSGGAAAPWLGLLLAYDAVLWTATWAVFPIVLEE